MSKKQSLFPFFVIILIWVAFLFSDSLSDFISSLSGWHNIESIDKYWITAIDNSNHSVWFAEFGGDKKLNYYVPSKNKIFSVDTKGTIDSICVSDRTWVILIQEDTYKIESIDTTSNLEVSYPNLDGFGKGRCFVTPDNKTAFFGNNLLVFTDGQKTSQNYWTIDKELLRVSQKPSGEIFALTQDGEIYIANSPNFDWRLFGKVNKGLYQLKTINDTLWVGMDETNKIYKWNLTEKSPEVFTLKNNNQNGSQFLVTVEEVAPNVIWVITTTGIWEYQNEQFKEVDMPIFTKHISSAVFDKGLKRMYLATNRGIYFKEIGQP